MRIYIQYEWYGKKKTNVKRYGTVDLLQTGNPPSELGQTCVGRWVSDTAVFVPESVTSTLTPPHFSNRWHLYPIIHLLVCTVRLQYISSESAWWPSESSRVSHSERGDSELFLCSIYQESFMSCGFRGCRTDHVYIFIGIEQKTSPSTVILIEFVRLYRWTASPSRFEASGPKVLRWTLSRTLLLTCSIDLCLGTEMR
jgi:hypothetical protein